MLSIQFIIILLLSSVAFSLKIATSLQWIEHTPQPYAIKNFYKGSTSATLTSGGVANLGSDKSVDLAANAETQGLKQYASHKNIRLIYMICEASYRIVANKKSGIKDLKDLKGKKIGTIPGTSAGVFISRMMNSVGVKEYTTVSGNVCMKAPCGSGTFPAMMSGKQIDAFGVWEPAVELGAKALGDDAVIFQNGSIYREMYALYTTTDKLNDPAKRKDIVEFVKALNRTLDVFNNKPESVYQFVANEVGSDAKVIADVWEDHKWSGRWGDDLLDLLVDEDKYLATQDKRASATKADLEKFLDTSIIEEISGTQSK
ncbi:periplasmic binding protein-like II [Aaosphaeria arxii CBS 175.79]|uniref:Periplasmic binding protein-like II n=1 Tax=Aaosphaeria arxii CBS 175.79 TaxID=1450172 RepID=A0A6A5XV22_9PLEO|nr:periplasmic binding protein-like II [Aaosphaeria arxii CBS 175.79]KAF2016789.1 periplasmic binding protein-like II [Aaosphaeria arxii CBS 175.79]